MSVILKRTSGAIRNECTYGCCTDVYGKNVAKVRRRIKRSEKRNWKNEVKLNWWSVDR